MSETRIDGRGVVVRCPRCGQGNRVPFERLDTRGRCGTCGDELPAIARPAEVVDPAHLEALVRRSAVPVLVDFWAGWCGPCRMLAPELERLATSEAGSLLIVKVDTESQPALASRHGVRSLPTLVLFSAAREQARTSGARPAEALAAFVRQARTQEECA